MIDDIHDIHIQDNNYDAKELSTTITLLDGLCKSGRKRKVGAIVKIHNDLADRSLLDEEQNEVSRYQEEIIKQCYYMIDCSAEKIKEAINQRINYFCKETVDPEVKRHLANK